jgi:3-deoxy-7-phosphoheptulonate synthase
MIVVIEPQAHEDQIESVIQKLNEFGFDVHKSSGATRTVIGVIGETSTIDIRDIKILPGVAEVYKISEPFKLVGRHFHPENTVFNIRDIEVGGDEVVIMSGPCSVESEEQIFTVAETVRKSGARILRGGAFKPRTSPYSFQGLGEKGLILLKKAADTFDMPVITEVMDKEDIELIDKYTDIFQVGARNMQNFSLLKALGKVRKPIFLKRGISATIQEWLMSAEYLLAGGNKEVILCERGIRTFETYTRNTLDISAIPVVKKYSHLPVFVDPSHGTGIRNKVGPMARAGVAAGADGLMIEVHHQPELALSDGAQSLYPDQFEKLMRQLEIIAQAIDKKIS